VHEEKDVTEEKDEIEDIRIAETNVISQPRKSVI
jgi:hypothetical protein